MLDTERLVWEDRENTIIHRIGINSHITSNIVTKITRKHHIWATTISRDTLSRSEEFEPYVSSSTE